MEKKFNKYFIYYLSLLFFFSIVYLFQKHTVGNDSTISEWLINYQGGFTKRGLIGQLSIFLADFLKLDLRQSILGFQIFIIGLYFISLFIFFRNVKLNKIILLSIFTPIFILYPIAEIEVLARKEVFIFLIFIFYVQLNSELFQNLFKLIFLPISILIWEPVIFYFLFFISIDIIKNNYNKINDKFLLNFIFYFPSALLAIYIAFNPITTIEHEIMANYLKDNFNENCYMSCDLLKTKSTIYAQFAGNFDSYSYEVFLRYFLIILFGFGPLLLLLKNSYLTNNQIIFFKNFDNLLAPIGILYLPIILLFAMGYDWGRWVNISYVFGIIFYIYFFKKKIIIMSDKLYDLSIYKLFNNKKIFIAIFMIFCFGWNPKTVITGDVASNPLWKIPYNASKILFGFKNFRILQDNKISIWHKKFIE